MTENTSVNKKILYYLDEFTQFKSLFEMLSDTGMNADSSFSSIKIILVQDTIGSEFLEFFLQEMFEKFQIQEIFVNEKKTEKQLDEIGKIFEELKVDEKVIDKEEGKNLISITNGKIPGKKIILLNNPIFTNASDQKKIIDITKFISSKLQSHQDYYFILRIVSENTPRELMDLINYSFKIPYPTKIQRITILETLLKELDIHTVDITHLSEMTEDKWNVNDLKRLVNRAYIQWKLLNFIEFKTQFEQESEELKINDSDEEKQETSPTSTLNGIPKIPFTTEIFSELIINNIVCPLGMYSSYKSPIKHKTEALHHEKENVLKLPSEPLKVSNLMDDIGFSEIDSFTSSQLYQFAAAKKFEELTSTLEKLDQGKKLDEMDRKILADYAFILKDPPNRALLKLTNARKTIDRIQKISER